MKTTLSTTVKIIRQPEIASSLAQINLLSVTDLPSKKEILAHIAEQSQPILLWSGADYEALPGTWTNEIAARLTQVLAAAAVPSTAK